MYHASWITGATFFEIAVFGYSRFLSSGFDLLSADSSVKKKCISYSKTGLPTAWNAEGSLKLRFFVHAQICKIAARQLGSQCSPILLLYLINVFK